MRQNYSHSSDCLLEGSQALQNQETYFEFFAEIDILCALSTCPGGDLSAWSWAASGEMRKSCRPLGAEVYRITDPAILENWEPPPPASYKGLHGIKLPMYKQDG